tara:strand:- start:486 stop:1715 length:1230 start_codon:yes stop_codon:yes gene_type:complete
MNLHKINKQKSFVIILVIILGSSVFSSYFQIIKDVLSPSGHHDFQWSPTKLVFENVNHYHYMLSGNIEKIMMSQYGEYLHGLYILFYPYTLLEWTHAKVAWMLTNIILLFLIPIMLCKKFSLSAEKSILIIFFFCFCIVSKVQIVTGQQTLLILFFFILPFIKETKLNVILSGISYFKYTIGYSIFLYYLSSNKFKFLLLTMLPAIFGWLFYSFITNSSPFITIFQPFELALENQLVGETTNNMPKNKFIFSIFETISLIDFYYKSLLFLTLSIIFNYFFIFKIKSLNDSLLKLSCLSLSTLIFFPHYPHDYVMMLPFLVYSIKNFSFFVSKITFILTVYFLHFFKGLNIYLVKGLNYLSLDKKFLDFFDYSISYINILLLLFILVINLISNNKINVRNTTKIGAVRET